MGKLLVNPMLPYRISVIMKGPEQEWALSETTKKGSQNGGKENTYLLEK